ncbi:MAG: hypothetical protein JNK02_15355 [Planctomycetes bacterium]|nr:hypothetical protein [Planctomycetota bacterium]
MPVPFLDLLRALGALPALAAAGIPQEPVLRLPPVSAQPPAEFERLDRLGGDAPPVDETGLAPAFVEIHVPRASVFAGELVHVELRFGLEATFLDEQAIPLFRRRLDVPVQVEAAWLDEPEALELARLFADEPGALAALVARNERVAAARRLPDRVVNGRTWRVWALAAPQIPPVPGALVLAAPRLHFARGTDFRADFLQGRTATGRRDGFVRGAALALEVLPIPGSGRPPGSGAVAAGFDVEARATWDVVSRPAGVRLELAFRGDGDLARAELPDAAAFRGFRVRGLLDDHGRARRRVVYDLEQVDPDVREIPPLGFAYFDPRPPGAWREAGTPPFPVPGELRARAAELPAAAAPGGGAVARPAPPWWILLALLALVAGLAWAARRWRSGKRTGGGSA